MNSVGIDISKGRSTVAVMRPFGEVVISPFEVRHTDSELSELARQLKSLDGETRVVMEATGNYHASVAKLLYDAGTQGYMFPSSMQSWCMTTGTTNYGVSKPIGRMLSNWLTMALTAGLLCRSISQRKIPDCC